jgi:septation ring formation regulator EzrA
MIIIIVIIIIIIIIKFLVFYVLNSKANGHLQRQHEYKQQQQ